MDYELYHDESLEGGYWHGMLLVPAEHKQEYLDLLVTARKNSNYDEKIGLKNVRHKQGKIYNCVSAWAQIGVVCMRSKINGFNEYVFLRGEKANQGQYKRVDLCGLKFILFREPKAHKELTGYKDNASKIETTFRFGLKGGLHFLGSNEEPISITKIHFDGYEHHHRHIDKTRIIDRINGLREYCRISDRPDLIDDRRSNHNDSASQEYGDCQFLQLTDVLIGCFRTSLGYGTKDIHLKLALPVKRRLVNEYSKGYARMRNSRWFNSFVLSQCYLEDNGQWKFEGIERNPSEGVQPKLL